MPLDTSPEMEARHIKLLRSFTVEQRLCQALDLCLLSRELMKAGIRHRNPEWSEDAVSRELHRNAFYPSPLPDWVR